jgi:SAM-dependent methyltransferase
MQFLKRIVLRENFAPSLLSLFINPFYFARRGLYKAVNDFSARISGKVLDVGCGTKPYQKLFLNAREYVGLELDTETNRNSKNADFFYDGKVFPFDAAEFDSLVVNQVFEHVFNPSEFLAELNRVVRLEGMLLLTVPFVWDEHEQPYDYARYSSFGLKAVLAASGFEVVEARKTSADIAVVFQLINAYLFKLTVTKSTLLNVMVCFFLMAPFNIVGALMAKILPGNDDLYLDNVVIAKKVSNA